MSTSSASRRPNLPGGSTSAGIEQGIGKDGRSDHRLRQPAVQYLLRPLGSGERQESFELAPRQFVIRAVRGGSADDEERGGKVK